MRLFLRALSKSRCEGRPSRRYRRRACCAPSTSRGEKEAALEETVDTKVRGTADGATAS